MITQKDAIAIGSAICAAAKRSTEEHAGAHNTDKRIAARANAIYAMDNFWYNVMPVSLREKFDYSREKFYVACGWPD